MDDLLKYEQIEQYWAGTLKGEALSTFKNQMKTDPNFAAEVQLHRDMQIVLSDGAALRVENKIKAIGQAYLEDQKPEARIVPMRSRFRVWAIAASIAILIAVASVLYFNVNAGSLTNEQLFADNFEVPVLLDKTRSSVSETAAILEDAYHHYENEEYEVAASQFKKIIETDTASMSVYFYAGISNMSKTPPDYNLALQNLEQVITQDNGSLVNEAKWYKALIWIKQGNDDNVKPLLEELSKGGKYRQKAKDLLEVL